MDDFADKKIIITSKLKRIYVSFFKTESMPFKNK